MPTPAELTDQLNTWLAAPGTRKRFLIAGGFGYCVFIQRLDKLELQASAGHQLPKEKRSSAPLAEQLYQWGLRQRRLSENYKITFDPDQDTLSKWADVAIRAMNELYEASSLTLTARAETHPALDNSPLLNAMKVLAKNRDWKARTDVYMKLVEAKLVVPVLEPLDTDTPLEQDDLVRVGTMGKFPVTAAFSSVEAIDKYDPRGLDLAIVDGVQLFPVLSVGKFGSIQINPRGDIGGELYSNEIWTVTEGIKRLRGSH